MATYNLTRLRSLDAVRLRGRNEDARSQEWCVDDLREVDFATATYRMVSDRLIFMRADVPAIIPTAR